MTTSSLYVMKGRATHDAPRRGFSLGELLLVMGIVAIMSALAITGFISMKKADSLNTATVTISTVLEQARAYAMANNTYVFVGFQETDASQPAYQAQTVGTGRIAVQAFASNDGTMNLANCSAIDKLQVLNNVDLHATVPSTGSLSRPATAPTYIVGGGSFPTASSTIPSRNFTFSQVIAFDALGNVHIPDGGTHSDLQYLEIDLQPSNGTVVSPTATNFSAVQVDAMTGAVSIYRP